MTDKVKQELQTNEELVEKILSAVCNDLAPSIQDGSMVVQLLRLFETPKESADGQEASQGELLGEILRMLHQMVSLKDVQLNQVQGSSSGDMEDLEEDIYDLKE